VILIRSQQLDLTPPPAPNWDMESCGDRLLGGRRRMALQSDFTPGIAALTRVILDWQQTLVQTSVV